MTYFINQPNDNLLANLERLLAENFNSFTIVVAYAKKSGVLLIKDSLSQFRENGGRVKAIIGIDQKNTSIEALRELLSLCDELFVFHCEDISQTFHPKLYFFNSENNVAEIIVGSSNLTNGGLQRNTELNTGNRLQYSIEEENVQIQFFNTIIDSYLQDENLCKPLTAELLETLIQQDYIISEQRLNQTIREEANQERANRIFGRGRRLRGLRRILTTTEVMPEEAVEEEEIPIRTTQRFFWKRLSPNDVSKTSSPGQMIIPISFYNFLPPFVNPEIKSNGARQEESFFDLLFIDSLGNQIPVLNARAIHYTPAPNHPRPNSEIRFTFRNQDILNLLEAGDILIFEETAEVGYSFIVRQIKTTSLEYRNYQGRFGTN